MDKRHRIGADGFTAADGAEALAGLGFDADLAGLEVKSGRDLLDHAGNIRSQFGPFEPHGGIDVNNSITGFFQKLADLLEEN